VSAEGAPTRPAPLLGAALPPGGVIGVPAPASPWENRSEVLRGVEWWESHGYRVKLAEGVWRRDAYVAGDAKARARDLEALFADPEVDVVQCLTGGYGSAQLIPNLALEVIAANPKPFIGYSDITALHVALRQATGLVTFYGPHLWTVGAKETSAFTRERMLAVLSGDGTGPVPADPDDPYVRPLRGGRVTAPLVGGCLWLLAQTMGTPWEVRLDGCILFIEDFDAPPWYVDGMLTQLGHAGKLDNLAGVVVGEMNKCDYGDLPREITDWRASKSIEDVLDKHLEPLGVPVLYKLPLGHGKHLASIPLGVRYTLDADERTLTVDESPFDDE
jgi:muramoyltetrapeptide carboxypeptidase